MECCIKVMFNVAQTYMTVYSLMTNGNIIFRWQRTCDDIFIGHRTVVIIEVGMTLNVASDIRFWSYKCIPSSQLILFLI